MPRITVVTPTYNAAGFLPFALQSAIDQTFSDLEVLVVDDGSTDGTSTLCRQWEQRYPKRIRFVGQPNAGPAAARNTALQMANGSLIALLDADDTWLPHRLEAGVRVLERNPAAGLVHGRMIIMDADGKELFTPKVDLRFTSGRIREHLLTRRAHIACPTVLFRRACLDRVGLFDTDPRVIGCEDRDLWIRLAAEYEIAFLDQPLAHYRKTLGSLSSNHDQMMKARVYVLDKHLGSGLHDRTLRRQALARISAELADQLMEGGQRGPALRSWVRSLTYWPFPRVAGSLAKHALGLGRQRAAAASR